MLGIDWSWILVVFGALLVLVEVALGGFAGFDLVLIGSALVVGGGLGLLSGSPALGIVAASALCLAWVAGGRRWVRRRMLHAPTLTNVDALVGQRGLVTQRIERHGPGQVRVRDEVWRAVPAEAQGGPFDPGAEVTVEGVDGVTLKVR